MTSLLSDARSGDQRPTWHRSPVGVVSSAGDEAIDLAKAAGLELDDWQQWVLRESLGERAGGTWAAFECGLVVGRQNGKNAILEARELAGIVLFGDDLITHTAHRADTTLEHFRRMEQYAEEFDDFRQLVKHVSHKNGDESIEIKGGRRIRFVSRARQPGRGFSGSCVVFDEALVLDAEAIGAIVPTLATRTMAQVWYTSSAPKASSSNLHALISRGRGEEPDDRLFFAEWGNEAGTDPDDVDGWYRSNPGLGIRISEEYIRAERRLMSGDADLEAEFMRERVGVPEMPAGEGSSPISEGAWAAALRPASTIDSHLMWALAVSPDRQWAALGKAGRAADGRLHVETVAHQRNYQDSIVGLVTGMWAQKSIPIRILRTGAAKAYIAVLRERGVTVVEVSADEYAQATGQVVDAAIGGRLARLDQRSLSKSVTAAELGPTGAFRPSGLVEISPLEAVTVAAGGVPLPVSASGLVDPNAVHGPDRVWDDDDVKVGR